jgi:penicillin-binding protein 2
LLYQEYATMLLPFQGWRLIFFRSVMFTILAVFAFRVYTLQFMQGAQFNADAQENRIQALPIAAPRGAILDRNGVILARNVPAFNLTVTPAFLPADRQTTLELYDRLSALVEVPATRAIADASGSNLRSIDELVTEGEGIAPFRPVVVARDIPPAIAFQIEESKQSLPGVNIEVRSVREYPTGPLTAQLIGYLGPIPEDEAEDLREQGYDPSFDRIGYSGIERFFETELGGRRGEDLYEVDVAGERLALLRQTPPIPGVTMQLTLDTELQQAAQEAIIERLNILNANEGRLRSQSAVVVAMDPRNGEILALVSWPTYDNSRFARSIDAPYYFELADDPLLPLVNHAISSLYPPGSVWKVMSAVAVVDEGVISPDSFLFDSGDLILPNAFAPNDVAASQRFVCWLRTGHGRVNLYDGIAQSCDVYYYQIGGGNPDVSPAVLRPGGLGATNLYRWATAFGVGSELGIELPLETAGRMPDPDWKRRIYGESWSTGDTYNAVFGQGYVTVTPLQQLAYVAAIANGGILYHPRLLKSFRDANGNVIQEFGPDIARHVVRPSDPQELPILLLQEDMLVQDEDSLACRCEPDSDFYDPARCNPDTYTAQFDADPNPDDEITNFITYRVSVPYKYAFNGRVCDPLSFDRIGRDYRPPFASTEAIIVVEEGMRMVVTDGTSGVGRTPIDPMTDVNEAGKTGTAEYCDDIARPLGLCIPGRWPSHAWYVGYAPYENPEIIVVAFGYNAGEGSQVAAPMVRLVMQEYFRLQRSRGLASSN